MPGRATRQKISQQTAVVSHFPPGSDLKCNSLNSFSIHLPPLSKRNERWLSLIYLPCLAMRRERHSVDMRLRNGFPVLSCRKMYAIFKTGFEAITSLSLI
eukprot:GHVL01018160.1.p2 GENE.GHVL01018160.1~~GHVL01018160.1.p2  ORF type:complete len:100 (+),score=0.03 GHVL01018160.1:258-557(+)